MKRGREVLPPEKMQTIGQVLAGCTPAQLMTIWDMVEAEHNHLTEIDDAIRAREWKVDDQVKFKGKKVGEILIGRVKKINARTLTIIISGTGHKWRVPFSMAEKM